MNKAPTKKLFSLTGMVPFAIGSETCGSITSPAARCGVTALRPTFGAVGRTGVMSISESLVSPYHLHFMCYIYFPYFVVESKYTYIQDKIGPFCRSAADCSIILDAILGKDPDDPSSKDISLDDPFSVDITNLTVGYLDDAEMEVRVGLCIKITIFEFKLSLDRSLRPLPGQELYHVHAARRVTLDFNILNLLGMAFSGCSYT